MSLYVIMIITYEGNIPKIYTPQNCNMGYNDNNIYPSAKIGVMSV